MAKTNRKLAILSGVLLLLAGCVSVSQKEVELWTRWKEDDRAPTFELPHSSGAAIGLSLLFPALGHMYIERGTDAILWSTAGLVLWPTGIPAVFAGGNSDRLNIKFIAKRYAEWLEGGPAAVGGRGQQQQQQQQQQVVVITNGGGGGGAVTTGQKPQPAKPRKQRLDELERLAKLRRDGVLTEAEFKREKAKIIDGN